MQQQTTTTTTTTSADSLHTAARRCKIPQAYIHQLLARIDLVRLIGSRITLHPVGKEYHGLCPFHKDVTPSFTVVPDKGFYHCFGCQAHGNAINFVMQYDRLGFRQAVTELAQLAGMTSIVGDETTDIAPSTPSLYGILESAQQYFQTQLHDHPEGRRALDYLKHRGIGADLIERFGLGYAPAGWNALLHEFRNDCDLQTLVDSGLVVHNPASNLLVPEAGHYYDRFRQRLMFPIRDRQGRTIAFGARAITDEQSPKYLNSPESAAFKKTPGPVRLIGSPRNRPPPATVDHRRRLF